MPPFFHPTGEEPEAWGPGVKLPTDMPDRYGYFESPRYDPGSKEMEITVREFADEYFGRARENNQVEAATLKGELVRTWLLGWWQSATQLLKLCQQYLPDEVFYTVVGGAEQARPLRATRDEIQGEFHLQLVFNLARPRSGVREGEADADRAGAPDGRGRPHRPRRGAQERVRPH